MPTLRDTQRAFRGSLFDREAPWPDQAIRAAGAPPQKRMDVYRNNVFHSLGEALGDLYPAVRRLVGDGFFAYAANAYLRARPVRQATLITFAEDFPEFIAAFPAAASLAYLADVARLELAWHQAYHAADAEPIDGAVLRAVPPASLPAIGLALLPSCRLIHSPFPIERIWEANMEDGDGGGAIDLSTGSAYVLVVRPRYEVEVRSLSAGAFHLVSALAEGRALGEAAETALAAQPGLDLQGTLASLIAGGTFADIILAT